MQRVALVTGASRGLGATVAEALANLGFDLVIDARNAAILNDTAHSLARHGNRIIAIAGDIAEAEHRRKLAEAVRSLGRLDLLVNNASILGMSPQPDLANYPLEILEQVYAVNVMAPLGLIQEVLPLLRAAHGTVINISSDAAIGGYVGWGAYGSSKAALDLISLTLANELRDQDIAVVSVDPGDMRTQMHQEAFPDDDISDRPLPDVTIPFWLWLLGQPATQVTGRRFQAQSEQWLNTPVIDRGTYAAQ